MSHAYFNNLWAEGQAELRQALANEKKLGQGTEIPDSNRINFFAETAKLYYKWISMYKKFDEAYDQIVHPQKLPLLRKLLDIVISRLVELRHVMVGTELSEVLYFDDVMHFYSWMPYELDIPIPKYYIFHCPERKEREDILERAVAVKKAIMEANAEKERERLLREKVIADFRRKLRAYEQAAAMMHPSEAVAIIQVFERHRQGVERVGMAKYVEMEETARRRRKFKSVEIFKYTPEEAAVIIQKLVRGFLARRRVKKIREKEMSFLGLLWAPSVAGDEKDVHRKRIEEMEDEIKKNAEKRRRVRWRYQKNFEEAQELIESRIQTLEAPEMAERMKWQLRTWMLHIKEKEGKLPDIPKPQLGGSMNIFCPERLPQEILDKIAEGKAGKKKKGKKGKKSDKKKKDKKDKKKGKKKKKKRELVATKLEQMTQMEDALKFNTEYNMKWRHKDESNNLEQNHEDEPIIIEKRLLVGQQTRDKVDILMKSELSILKSALDKKGGKKKKGKGKKKGKKKGKGKKGKGKKKKGKKGKKKKKFKDLTPDRTWQSLFEELVNEGVIIDFPKTKFEDLIGDYSLVNETIRKYFAENPMPPAGFNQDSVFKMPFNANPPPTYGDIKRAIRDICVIPIGSPTVHEMVNFAKSLLIAGPKGSGKKSLVHAVCTEMRATLFDLTAANIAGKYPGKSGLTMLIHLVNKVARICQPSIILIEDAEKTFMKKVPKTDKTDPKRLKKQLKKFLKIIGPEDQMMLIGLTSEPWAAKMKPMKKTFEKVLFIPKPDHAARLEMWERSLAEAIPDFHHHMHLPLLAKLSDSWTLGSIKDCAAKVIEDHQKIAAKEIEDNEKPYEFNFNNALKGGAMFKTAKIGKKSIRMDEILDELALRDPIFLEQEKAWNSWFNKTPLQKLRNNHLTGRGKTDKKGKKGKKGKGRAGKKR